MRKCKIGNKECKNYRARLECLACEQKQDKNYKRIHPQIIKPISKEALEEYLRIEMTDKEMIYMLAKIVGGMTFHRIANALGRSPHTIKSYVEKGLEKIEKYKRA